MFSVREIPIVIEPGVAVLEAEVLVKDRKVGERQLAAHFYRVPLDEKIVQELPLVPTTQHPHVFSLHENINESPVLLVYDLLGRLSLLYTRDATRRSWDRHSVIDEHAGKTVTQFSVRFCFSALKDRNKFLDLVNNMSEQVRVGNQPSRAEMTSALGLLARSRVAPIVLPVAVAKSKLKNVRL